MRKYVALALLAALPFFSAAGPRSVLNGGDVLPTLPVTRQDIENTIPDARIMVVSWLHQLEARTNEFNALSRDHYVGESSPAIALLLADPNKLYDILDHLNIRVAYDRPCPSDNEHVDGSVFSFEDHEICLSSFAMAQTLDQDNYKINVQGLIVHELSHLLGADESEAVSLQLQYKLDMTRTSWNFLSQAIYPVVQSWTGQLEASIWINQFCEFAARFGHPLDYMTIQLPDYAQFTLTAADQKRFLGLLAQVKEAGAASNCAITKDEGDAIESIADDLVRRMNVDYTQMFTYRYWDGDLSLITQSLQKMKGVSVVGGPQLPADR